MSYVDDIWLQHAWKPWDLNSKTNRKAHLANLKINENKTKEIRINVSEVDNVETETIKHFSYVGSTISLDEGANKKLDLCPI